MKWDAAGTDFTSPVFFGVTINATATTMVSDHDDELAEVQMKGCYSPVSVVADDKIENLKQENTLSNVVIVEFESEVSEDLLRSIPQVGRVQHVKDNHWILEPQGDTDIRANLMRWSVDRGLIIKTLQKEDMSIEEAFQKLTKG